MKAVKPAKILFALLPLTIFNILIVSSTLILHEAGHFLAGVYVGCTNIKLVLFDSKEGTYTQMSCPDEQPVYFPLSGAFILTAPFALSFLSLRKFPERSFFWIILGYNFIISMLDVPKIAIFQIFTFISGLLLIIIGETLLIDKLLLFIRKNA